MADDTSCCRNDGGKKHLPGCDGSPSTGRGGRKLNKAIANRRDNQGDYDKNKARQKQQAKLKNVGKPRSTDFMEAEIPEGYKSVKTGDGRYIIVKK